LSSDFRGLCHFLNKKIGYCYQTVDVIKNAWFHSANLTVGYKIIEKDGWKMEKNCITNCLALYIVVWSKNNNIDRLITGSISSFQKCAKAQSSLAQSVSPKKLYHYTIGNARNQDNC